MKRLLYGALIALFAIYTTSCQHDWNEDLIVETDTEFVFLEQEQIVEVDDTTTSFTLECRWNDDWEPSTYQPYRYNYVSIDAEHTTAQHNVHFINTIVNPDTINFTASDSSTYVHHVKIIPQNITESVEILYRSMTPTSTDPTLILSHRVILRPRVN